jgi:phosphatidate cytidylyltransferase
MEPPGTAQWRDLGRRTLSAIILIPVVLSAVWGGGVWFTLLVAVVGVAIAYEWTDIVHARNATQFALHATAAIAGALLPPGAGLAPALAVLVILTALGILLDVSTRGLTLWGSLGIPYAGLPSIALVMLRADPNFGMKALFWLLVVIWASDTAAYFAGRLIGGPKLAPVISPNKTWAGAVGALIGSAIVAALAGEVLIGAIIAPAFVGVVLSLVAQAGDLFKSILKRSHGLKDSGNLIPGHGGIIDRVDGVVAAAVAAAIIGILHSGPGAAAEGLLVW